jgi:hypothetical protein
MSVTQAPGARTGHCCIVANPEASPRLLLTAGSGGEERADEL